MSSTKLRVTYAKPPQRNGVYKAGIVWILDRTVQRVKPTVKLKRATEGRFALAASAAAPMYFLLDAHLACQAVFFYSMHIFLLDAHLAGHAFIACATRRS